MNVVRKDRVTAAVGEWAIAGRVAVAAAKAKAAKGEEMPVRAAPGREKTAAEVERLAGGLGKGWSSELLLIVRASPDVAWLARCGLLLHCAKTHLDPG